MVEQPKWEWFDAIFGMVTGALSSMAIMMGWISRQFGRVHERHHQLRADLDAQIDDVHGRATALGEDVAALMAHHESDRERLQSIDKKLDRIEEFLRHGKR